MVKMKPSCLVPSFLWRWNMPLDLPQKASSSELSGTDGKLVNFFRLRAKSKGQLKCLHDFLFADDTAVTAQSSKDLLQSMNSTSSPACVMSLSYPSAWRRSKSWDNLWISHSASQPLIINWWLSMILRIWAQQSWILLLLTWSWKNELTRPPPCCLGWQREYGQTKTYGTLYTLQLYNPGLTKPAWLRPSCMVVSAEPFEPDKEEQKLDIFHLPCRRWILNIFRTESPVPSWRGLGSPVCQSQRGRPLSVFVSPGRTESPTPS